jgi:ABC-type proline/glycine betaine transport system substrate-binding protein
MRRKLLRSVLATAFVASLALGAVAASGVGWGSGTESSTASSAVQGGTVSPLDVGWGPGVSVQVSAARAFDVGW